MNEILYWFPYIWILLFYRQVPIDYWLWKDFFFSFTGEDGSDFDFLGDFDFVILYGAIVFLGDNPFLSFLFSLRYLFDNKVLDILRLYF